MPSEHKKLRMLTMTDDTRRDTRRRRARRGSSGSEGARGDAGAAKVRSRSGILGRLFAPLDGASLAIFRIAVGLYLFGEAVLQLSYGFADPRYLHPPLRFTYFGFGWVRPWPGEWGMEVHLAVMGVLGLLVAVGLFYRITAPLLFLSYAHFFLLDEAFYRNHLYLLGLVAFLLALAPAHRCFSLDALRRRRGYAGTVPAWTVWALRGQVGIAYLYAGFAKLSSEDWLRGEPMGLWLSETYRGGNFWSSRLDPLLATKEAALAMSYGGLFFDLLVFPALLWRRTRPFAFVAVVGFHVTNWQFFDLLDFPLLGLAMLPIFLSPSWPRRLLSRRDTTPTDHHPEGGRAFGRVALVGFLGLFFAWQALFPFRYLLYPENVQWTGGDRFAWHQFLDSRSAKATFYVSDPETGRRWVVSPGRRLDDKRKQEVARRPDMLLQYAHFLAERRRERGYEQVEVRARVLLALNGREPRLLVDPDVDLAAEARTAGPGAWVTPGTHLPPLPPYR